MIKTELAIIGMGFHVGEFDSVEAFAKGLVVSKKAFKSGTNNDGAFIFDRDILVEKTIAEALQDSGISEKEKKSAAFIWHHASAPQEKRFIVGEGAAKIAAHFGLGGISYNIYDGENSIFRGMALAQHLIGEKLASVVAICVTPPINKLSEAADGNEVEGSVVLLLKEKEQALLDCNKIYAGLSALTIIDEVPADEVSFANEDIVDEFVAALKLAEVTDGELRAVEVPDLGNVGYYEAIGKIFNEGLAEYPVKEYFFVADTESFIGERLAISTAASFVKHALQLFYYHVFIFEQESGDGVSFFVDKDPSIWNVHPGRRTTAITSMSDDTDGDGYIGFAVLTDCIDTMEDDQKCRCKDGLLPIACSDSDELCLILLALQNAILAESQGSDEGKVLKNICDEAWRIYKSIESPKYTVVLMFDTLDALVDEIGLLLAKKEEFTEGSDFNPSFRHASKRGSYFTAQPYGKDAKVVYMNPPGSAQHMLLFYEMLMLFPRYRNLYADISNGKFAEDMNELDYRFGRFTMELLMIGIVDQIAKNRFGLSADILTGASLGEIATMFANDCMETDLRDSPGTMKLMEAFLKAYTAVPYKLSVKYVKANIEDIRRAAAEVEDVYILVSASPYGAFVSGKPEAMEKFIEKNNFIAWALDLNSAIHTPYVEQYYDEIYEAMLECKNKFRSDLGVEVYSTYYKKPVGDTFEEIAKFVAAILIKPCDFYGLLEVLYDKGSRVFVDMSTGGTCLTWAQETFLNRDTLCFSIYPSFMDSRGSLLKTFAKLLSNHINVNIDTFLNSFEFSFAEESNPINLEDKVDMKSTASEMVAWPIDEHLMPAKDLTQAVSESNNNSSATMIEKNVLPSVDVTSLIHKYVNQTSLAAYGMYLENEKLLLEKLIKADKKPNIRLDEKLIEKPGKKQCLWDYDDIMEIIDGSPSKVWGEKYAALDGFEIRARLPLPPFMFVDRVVAIDAEFGKFRPSSIDIEYEITDDCILLISDSKVSILLLTEASHVAILLLAYIGIDLAYGGGVSYRILDSATTLHDDFPTKGDTICSRLEFVEFVQSGTITLVKSRYTSHVNGRELLTINILGGFFAEEDLNKGGMGMLPAKLPDPATLAGREPLKRMRPREELLTDLKMFYDSEYDVNFYRTRDSMDIEKLYIDPKAQMIDRIVSIDFYGGNYGLGCIIGEKEITEDHWSFDVHFKNDPVFPGSLLVEGANHLKMVFALNAGYAVPGGKYILSFELERPIKATFRGQVRKMDSVVRFVQHFKEIREIPKGVVLVSDCDVIWQDNIVARIVDLSVILEEK